MSNNEISDGFLGTSPLGGRNDNFGIPNYQFSLGVGGNGLGFDEPFFGGFGREVSGSSNVTYGFSVGTNMVTETLNTANSTHSITFTQETSNTSLYQITGGISNGYECSSNVPVTSTSGSSSDSYSFSGLGTSMVTESINATNETTTITYAQETSNSSLYQISSETITYNTASSSSSIGGSVSYSFTESGGAVTGMSETFTRGTNTNTFSLTLDPSAVFTVGSNSVSETFATGNTVETVNYVSSGSAYVIGSVTTNFIAQGTATTALDVNPYDRAEFTISNGAVTAVQSVSPTGTTSTVATNSQVTFSPLATGFVEETVTFGSRTNNTVFYEDGSGGIYTEVAHGSGSTVDLVGLQTQLTHLPASVIALL